jgi:hypothetical protein
MDTKSKAGDALRTFCQEFGVPDRLTCDGSKEQTGKKTEFMQQVRKNDIDLHVIEPACVGFAKSCKEPQHKLADLMAVLLSSQLQARLLIFRSIWILDSTIQSGTTRTQVSERDYWVVGSVSRIVSEVQCDTTSLQESAQSYLARQFNELLIWKFKSTVTRCYLRSSIKRLDGYSVK